MLHKLSVSILQLTIGFTLAYCALAKKESNSAESVENYKKLAVDKYKDDITYQINLAHLYVLCHKQSNLLAEIHFHQCNFSSMI